MAAGNRKTITPQGPLTMATVSPWLDAGRVALRECDLVLDLAAVTETDSASLACIFDLHRIARARGRHLSVIGMPEELRNLAGVYGVTELLPQSD